MKRKLQQFAWPLFIVLAILSLVQMCQHPEILGVFLAGLALMGLSLAIKNSLFKYLTASLGAMALLLSLSMTYTFWGFLIFCALMLVLLHTDQGNAFLWFNEATIHPISSKQSYVGIGLVQPQSEQRSLIYKQAIIDQYQHKTIYEWHDINIVALGGDSIIDVGATILPEGESVIIIRKLFGKIRIIVPRDLALKMNITLIKGHVQYEQDRFELVNDTLFWQSAEYTRSNRRIKLMVSSVIGRVEVIRL